MSESKPSRGFGWLGIILIVVGVLLLFHNFGWLSWSWYRLWRAWPVVLVIWGLDLLMINERAKRALIIAIIVAMFIWVMGGFGVPDRMFDGSMMMRGPGFWYMR